MAETAARALGAIGPAAKTALPTMLDVIRDTTGTFDTLGSSTDNRDVRAAAAVAAARIDPQSDELLRVLERSLEEDNWIKEGIRPRLGSHRSQGEA